MTFNSEMIGRIIRGIAGLAMIAAGIIYENWIGLIGAFLLLGALGGGCGIGANSCSVKADKSRKEALEESVKEESAPKE